MKSPNHHSTFPLTGFVLYSDLGKDGLRAKSLELWDNVVRLETEKYDLEERQRRQGYDVS